jgi:hypothetical protein
MFMSRCIRGSRFDAYEEYGVLGCNAAVIGQNSARFLLISCLLFSSAQKMEVLSSSETSRHGATTQNIVSCLL